MNRLNRIEQLESLFRYPDRSGKTIEIKQESGKESWLLILHSPIDSPRTIGHLLQQDMPGFPGALVYYKREDDSQIHRNTKSWSINRVIADNVDYVQYKTPTAVFTVSQNVIHHFGLRFKWDKGGVDAKVFVPLRCWDIQMNDPFEQSIVKHLGYEWYTELGGEFQKPYMIRLRDKLDVAYDKTVTYPAWDNVFRAFRETPFSEVRCVILGQDPYHDGSATGLAFDNGNSSHLSPSLRNILKEMNDDLYPGTLTNLDGDLSRWAADGVLLLNTSLTVEAGKPGSHADYGWQLFTDTAIKQLVKSRKNLVFMLWGAYAQNKENLIPEGNLVLKAPHPSPLSASRGFFGCKHFSKANEYLLDNGLGTIHW